MSYIRKADSNIGYLPEIMKVNVECWISPRYGMRQGVLADISA